jgi:hypothetical protein
MVNAGQKTPTSLADCSEDEECGAGGGYCPDHSGRGHVVSLTATAHRIIATP